MLFRFSLYGFLKNQKYFEPFILLSFIEKGLTFTSIGILIGFREVAITLLEIPSGAVADLYGRRRSMILSFFAYIVSFIILAESSRLYLLTIAMLLFAVGEAFRTGTHKAMIFDWLRREGRIGERLEVYGRTRSWSKLGSALSALIAAGYVFVSGNYSSVFWLCTVPYVLNIVNFLGYPAYLDAQNEWRASFKGALGFSWRAVQMAASVRGLRNLVLESMLLEGTYKVVKDYLQPILEKLALALPVFLLIPLFDLPSNDARRGALLIGIVFCANYLLMSIASRFSGRASIRVGGEENLTRILWYVNAAQYLAMMLFLLLSWRLAAVLCFIIAGVIQNLFRPTQISRFDTVSPAEMGATILSVESQAKALAAALIAPLVGYGVDRLLLETDTAFAFWPVAAAGLLSCSLAILRRLSLH